MTPLAHFPPPLPPLPQLMTGPHSVISVAGGAGVFAGSTAADEENLASGGGGVLKVTTDTAKDVSNFYISGGDLQV